MGSCFTESIGEKLDYYKFQNTKNPFGIIFHPVAIEKLVTRAINEIYFTEDDVFFYNEQWHCFEAHSLLSNSDKESFLKILNEKLQLLNKSIKSATHIIFTYGTSWVYRHIETDTHVANCHKFPQKKFLKELLSVEEVSASIENTTILIKAINSEVSIINTVSPVRHLKDGFVENTRSKAHLISGIHHYLETQNSKNYAEGYFPSYEIMMDELRDYRFYKEDMIHPNRTSISIIWNAFNTVWINSETKGIQKEIAAIQKGLSHKPFNPSSVSNKQFLKLLYDKIEKVKTLFPKMQF